MGGPGRGGRFWCGLYGERRRDEPELGSFFRTALASACDANVVSQTQSEKKRVMRNQTTTSAPGAATAGNKRSATRTSDAAPPAVIRIADWTDIRDLETPLPSWIIRTTAVTR